MDKKKLINRGWVCDLPEVRRIWFLGCLKHGTNDMYLRLEILFDDFSRHSMSALDFPNMALNDEEGLIEKLNDYLLSGGRGTSIPFNETIQG